MNISDLSHLRDVSEASRLAGGIMLRALQINRASARGSSRSAASATTFIGDPTATADSVVSIIIVQDNRIG